MEDFNYFSEKLNVKEKMYHHLFRDFNWFIKKIGHEELNEERGLINHWDK